MLTLNLSSISSVIFKYCYVFVFITIGLISYYPKKPKIPDLAKTVCAIIEFEAADAAKFAVQTLRFRTKELGFRLALLETGVNIENYVKFSLKTKFISISNIKS